MYGDSVWLNNKHRQKKRQKKKENVPNILNVILECETKVKLKKKNKTKKRNKTKQIKKMDISAVKNMVISPSHELFFLTPYQKRIATKTIYNIALHNRLNNPTKRLYVFLPLPIVLNWKQRKYHETSVKQKRNRRKKYRIYAIHTLIKFFPSILFFSHSLPRADQYKKEFVYKMISMDDGRDSQPSS